MKPATVGVVAFLTVWPQLPSLGASSPAPARALLSRLGGPVEALALQVRGALRARARRLRVAAAQRAESIRMTQEEVRQEGRQTDVSPEVRGAIRRRQFESAQRRMLADVPTADVVVVNPTHFAVALRYDGTRRAPEVVAKGGPDRRRDPRGGGGARRADRPRPAARAHALHREVELGAEIPEQLLAAVAEVLAFVYRLGGGAGTPEAADAARGSSTLKRRRAAPITRPPLAVVPVAAVLLGSTGGC